MLGTAELGRADRHGTRHFLRRHSVRHIPEAPPATVCRSMAIPEAPPRMAAVGDRAGRQERRRRKSGQDDATSTEAQNHIVYSARWQVAHPLLRSRPDRAYMIWHGGRVKYILFVGSVMKRLDNKILEVRDPFGLCYARTEDLHGRKSTDDHLPIMFYRYVHRCTQSRPIT